MELSVKNNMMLKVALFVSLCSTSAHAYKISIYTDEPNQTKAREVLNTFKATYPFNQFEIEIEICFTSGAQLWNSFRY